MQATPSGGMAATAQKPGQGDEGEGKKKNAWVIPVILGCAVMFGLSSCAGIGIVAAIAVPNFRRARDRANQRACFANQKTIAGAMEMYNLDNGTNNLPLDETLFDKLKAAGYLQRIPKDPGQGENTSHHYITVPTTDSRGQPDCRIFCTHHGFIQPPAGSTRKDSPRKQLEALGVTDEDILARAEDKLASHQR